MAGLPAGGRMLVVKLSSLGDVLHALPAVSELARAGGMTVDWAVQPACADLVSAFSCVDRVIEIPRPSSPLAWFRALRRLRREAGPYDLVVDFQGLLKSAVVARAARRVPGALLLGPSFAREGSRFFYGALAGRRDKNRHAVDECFDAARFLGVAVPEVPAFPLRLPPVPDDVAAELGLVPEPETAQFAGPLVAFAPYSRWKSKNWPEDSFAAAISLVANRLKGRIALLGGPGDRDGAARIAATAAVPCVNLCGRLSILQSAAVLRRCAALVTNDSGPMHLAAAVGTPCVAPFGPTSAKRTGPCGARHRVLRAPEAVCARAPCRRRVCPRGDMACMTAVSPQEVAVAVERAVAETSGGGGT